MSYYTEVDELEAVITTQELLASEIAADISDYLNMCQMEAHRQS